MRLVAEEKRSGTYEMLMTAPVTEFEVAMSKYIAAVSFYLFMLAPTLLYIYILARHGRPDYGTVTSGYVGVIMLACVYLAIGLLVSSLTNSQMVAGAVTLVILLLMWVIGWAGENARSDVVREVFAYLSFSRHLEAFGKGLIDTRDVVYYASVIFMCLFGTVRSLESRRWR
jgi:ABC-2 type transport system permease protein